MISSGVGGLWRHSHWLLSRKPNLKIDCYAPTTIATEKLALFGDKISEEFKAKIQNHFGLNGDEPHLNEPAKNRLKTKVIGKPTPRRELAPVWVTGATWEDGLPQKFCLLSRI